MILCWLQIKKYLEKSILIPNSNNLLETETIPFADNFVSYFDACAGSCDRFTSTPGLTTYGCGKKSYNF